MLWDEILRVEGLLGLERDERLVIDVIPHEARQERAQSEVGQHARDELVSRRRLGGRRRGLLDDDRGLPRRLLDLRFRRS